MKITKMIYDDIVYGKTQINEPVILEIINSPEMQRLKSVDQAGYIEPFFPGSAHYRFDHSMGVYLLLKKYGASLEEQIAGLIHDLSHGTFSHCLDYVFEEGDPKTQSHQDSIFDEFVKNSSISSILKKYGWKLEYILDDKRHPLKENNGPNICADRIDYSLRDAIHYDKTPVEKIKNILNNLKVVDNNRIFDNIETTREYSNLFLRLDDVYWSGIESAVMFTTVGKFLKHARKKGYIERDDFYTTDKEVLDKINGYLSTDNELRLLRERMNNKIPFENNPNNYHDNVFCKTRIVDPLFMENGDIFRLSDRDEDWKNVVINKNKAKEYFIRFEK